MVKKCCRRRVGAGRTVRSLLLMAGRLSSPSPSLLLLSLFAATMPLLSRTGSAMMAHSFNMDEPTTTTKQSSSSFSTQSFSRALFREPLVEWLDQLQVHISNQSFSAKIATIEIQDLVCTHFVIQTIESAYIPSCDSSDNYNSSRCSSNNGTSTSTSTSTSTGSATRSPARLQLLVHQIAASCQGTYRVDHGAATGKITALLTTAPDATTALAWQIAIRNQNNNNTIATAPPYPFTPTGTRSTASPTPGTSTGRIHSNDVDDDDDDNTTRFPDSMETVHCDTQLAVNDLHFSGSASAQLVDLFAARIQRAVNDAVHDQICPALVRAVDPVASRAIRATIAWLRPYLIEKKRISASSSSSQSPESEGPSLMSNEGSNSRTSVDTPDLLRDATHERRGNWSKNEALPPTTTTRYFSAATSSYFQRDMEKADIFIKHDEENDDDESMIQFDRDFPVLKTGLTVMNSFSEAHLDHGFVPSSSSSTSPFARCGGFASGINGVLRQALSLNNDTTWNLPVASFNVRFVVPNYAALNVTIHNVTLVGEGLSQWKKITLLQPMDAFTFATNIETDSSIVMSAAVTLNVSTIPGGMFHGDPLMETFLVRIGNERLRVAADLSVKIVSHAFRHFTVESFMSVVSELWSREINKDWTPETTCFLNSISNVSVSSLSLEMNVSEVSVFPVNCQDDAPDIVHANKHLEQDIDDLVDNAVELILTEYRPLVTNAISGLTRNLAQDSFNGFLAHIMDVPYTTNCTNIPTENDFNGNGDQPHWVNFTKVKVLHDLGRFLNETATMSVLNRYLDCTVDVIDEEIRRPDPPQSISTMDHGMDWKVMTVSSFSSLLQLRDVELRNFGRLQALELMLPTEDGLSLKNTLQFGSNVIDSANRPQVIVSMDISLSALNVTVLLNATVFLDDLNWDSESTLLYDSRQLMEMTMFDLLSHGSCAVVPVKSFNLSKFEIGIGFLEAIINMTVQSSREDSAIEVSIDSMDFPDFQGAANAILSWGVSSTRDLLVFASKVALSRSASVCFVESHSIFPDNSPEDGRKKAVDSNALLLILAALFIFAQPAILLVKRPKETVEDDESFDGFSVPLLLSSRPQESLASERRSADASSSSLMFDTSVPEVARYLLPISVVVSIVLLISSNLNVGASVDLIATISGRHIRIPSLFEFSLLNTAADMLKAKIYPLFFLVVGFSGIWPYAKLVLLLAAWTCPRTTLPNDQRGQLLLKLDAFSKFSLVDTYVLVVMLVAFRYKLQLLDDTEFNVYVTPEYGFYGFLVATSASLIIGHLMVFFHRRSELQGLDPSNDIDCIFNHAFLMRDGSVRKLSVKFRCLIATMGVSVGSLLATGITMKTFGFEFGGLAGSMLGDQHQKQYSLLSIGAAIPSSVEDSPGAGIYALQAVYYFYAVVTPFVALLTMSCLLIYPLSRKIQLCLLTIAEIANSWSAVEVFGLSIVAAMLEISTFADFIIGSRCDLLNALLTEYGEGDIVTCYSVKSTISWHAVYLLIGSLLYSVWIYVVLQLLHTAMYERMHNDGNPQDDHWTIAQTMASSSFARMIFVTREDDLDEGVPTLSSNSTGPPIVSEELLVSPWQQENFTKEWKDAAERDPTWKEWKEATSVT